MRDRTALVTGASRGIGRAIALELAARGARVAINYRENIAAAEAVLLEIQSQGGHAVTVAGDIGDPRQVDTMLNRAVMELGPVEILVNNAALLYISELQTFDRTEMEAMRRVNVDGLINVTRGVVPGMIEARFGRIINIASIAAHGTTFPGNTFYAATKAAVVTLTRRFALEFGRFGVTVNAVAPGFIETDMALQASSVENRETLVEKVASMTMMCRIGRPSDIAHAVSFLASDEASFITAQVLTVDGGRMDYIAHP
jgi:3-oxoacyl-[acyl-carrier protein] reductase